MSPRQSIINTRAYKVDDDIESTLLSQSARCDSIQLYAYELITHVYMCAFVNAEATAVLEEKIISAFTELPAEEWNYS